MRSVTIFIPARPRSLNEIYAGSHWSKRKKEADEIHRHTAVIVSELAIESFKGPVSISMTPSLGKGARSRDCTNWSYALKLIEDGLVSAGLIPGDEADKVKRVSIESNVVDRKSPSGLWVTVSEYDGPLMEYPANMDGLMMLAYRQ